MRKSSEKRYCESSARMNEALVDLLKTKDFREITVTDICNAAGVNRSTFYFHYKNTYYLLRETKENLIKRFNDSFEKKTELNATLVGSEPPAFASAEYLVPYLEFIRDNKGLFRIYIANSNEFGAPESDEFLFKNFFRPILQKHGIYDDVAADYIPIFLLRGIMSVVSEWVKRDCREETSRICEVIILCLKQW